MRGGLRGKNGEGGERDHGGKRLGKSLIPSQKGNSEENGVEIQRFIGKITTLIKGSWGRLRM